MSSSYLLNLLGDLEIGLCLVTLFVIVIRKQWANYWSLGSFLAVRAASDSLLMLLIYMRGRQLGVHAAYRFYFYLYWVSFALESLLVLIVIYGIFRLAMAPLKGLQTLGMLVFRWAASMSVAVALGSAFAPHVSSTKYIMVAVSQLQQTQSILTLCLLLFVCFAIRPMGLDYASRIFGVSLGLGMLATTNLVQSAWLTHNLQIYGDYNLINAGGICLSLLVWTAYFAFPEPKRRMIVLPTTSPFLRWNQIAAALGDSPGFVAVGGVPPEIFAPAELEIMRRASPKLVSSFPDSRSLRA